MPSSEPTFAQAQEFAELIGRLLDAKSPARTYGGDELGGRGYYPDEFASALSYFTSKGRYGAAHGLPEGYDPRRIGEPLGQVLWGGISMPVPMSGRGYQQQPWERAFTSQNLPRPQLTETEADILSRHKDWQPLFRTILRGRDLFTPQAAYQAADPYQQMVYGHLLRMGYPLYGPSYKDYMTDRYGRGSEGLIGFGARE